MPIYEFQCKKCGQITSFIEKMDEIKFFSRKCSKCGSRRLKKVISGVSAHKRESMEEVVSELKRHGNVKFVPRPSIPQGPPPGGCPYHGESGKKEDNS